jgi:hypothetical protein
MYLNKQEIEKYWLDLVSQQDSDVNIIEGLEWNLDDNNLTNTRSILFDGYGYTIGETSEGKLVVCELEYPSVEQLTCTDFYLISRHLGFEVGRGTTTEEDVASYYGFVTALEIEY